MKRLLAVALASVAAAAIFVTPAHADPTGDRQLHLSFTAGICDPDAPSTKCLAINSDGSITVTAPYAAPFSGVTAMTDNSTYTAGKSIGANCTVAGNITVTFTDASTLSVPVAIGWQTFPFAATKWHTTDATCTVSELL